MGIENRKQARVNLTSDVVINGLVKVRGLDISEGGIYIHTGRSFKAGSIINIELPLPNATLKIRAKVQHSQEGVGMGLMFVELTPEQKQAIKSYMDDTMAQPNKPSGKKKILIVDDLETSRRMNKSKLMLEGFSVIEAKDGVEAIKMLQAEKVDAIVMDLYMDKMDGFKAMTIIRQTPEWAEIPIVVFSSRNSQDDMDRAMFAGANEFLPKMMTSPAKLCEKLKSMLK